MKRITIVIPTRNRWDKLRRALASCIEHPQVDVTVVCDGDRDTFDRLMDVQAHNLRVMYVPENKGAVFCRNLACKDIQDGLLYATDDIEFKPGAIDAALAAFNKHFTDDDGVVGFTQTPHSFHPSGVALMGLAFLGRYPDRQPFCPDYYHFAAQEIYELANKLGRFVQCPESCVIHRHPCFNPDQMDQTHKDARRLKKQDDETRRHRKAQGLIWGDQ